MTKIYLKAGERFELNGGVMRVGSSGTVVDTHMEWEASATYCGNDPKGVGHGIGTVVDSDRYTYDLFLDIETGQLFYDADLRY